MIIQMSRNDDSFLVFDVKGINQYDIHTDANNLPLSDITINLVGEILSTKEETPIKFKDGIHKVNILDYLDFKDKYGYNEISEITYNDFKDKLMIEKL